MQINMIKIQESSAMKSHILKDEIFPDVNIVIDDGRASISNDSHG